VFDVLIKVKSLDEISPWSFTRGIMDMIWNFFVLRIEAWAILLIVLMFTAWYMRKKKPDPLGARASGGSCVAQLYTPLIL